MMFDDLEAALSGAIHDVLSQAAVLRPRLRLPYTQSLADPGRHSHQTQGVFSKGPGLSPMGGGTGGFGGDLMINASVAEFWVSAAHVAQIPFDLETGDEIEISGQPGKPVYSIAVLQRTAAGDLNLVLSEKTGY